MEETQQIIHELLKSLEGIKKHSFQTQHELLKEAIKTNSLYSQILHQLNIQNQLLANRKIVTVENVS